MSRHEAGTEGGRRKRVPPKNGGEDEQDGEAVILISNTPALDKTINAEFKGFQERSLQKEAISKDNSAAYDRLKALGANRPAVKHAFKIAQMEEDERIAFDTTVRVLRHALGVPVQPDLFDESGTSKH